MDFLYPRILKVSGKMSKKPYPHAKGLFQWVLALPKVGQHLGARTIVPFVAARPSFAHKSQAVSTAAYLAQ